MICFVGLSSVDVCASVIKKWLVAPESNMAHLCMLSLVSVIVSNSAPAAPENPKVRHWSWYVAFSLWLLVNPGVVVEGWVRLW